MNMPQPSMILKPVDTSNRGWNSGLCCISGAHAKDDPVNFSRCTWSIRAFSLRGHDRRHADQVTLSSEAVERDIVWWKGVNDRVASNAFNPIPHANTFPPSLFLKFFQTSSRPSQLIPYYHLATVTPTADGVTLNTMFTAKRLDRLPALVAEWRGHVSVTLHLSPNEPSLSSNLAQLSKLLAANPLVRALCDIHIVTDRFNRQFNTWRNIARFFSRTEFVFMLDGDFIVGEDIVKELERARKGPLGTFGAVAEKGHKGKTWNLKDLMRRRKVALVVPAFEWTPKGAEATGRGGERKGRFIRSKKELRERFDRGEVEMFHNANFRGHGPTNYTKFIHSSQPYMIPRSSYQRAFEPYLIYPRDGPPYCDERFFGYGANKQACMWETFLDGWDTVVLADSWAVHRSHDYPEVLRAVERVYNRNVYDQFREESCMRYNRMHVALNKTLADSLGDYEAWLENAFTNKTFVSSGPKGGSVLSLLPDYIDCLKHVPKAKWFVPSNVNITLPSARKVVELVGEGKAKVSKSSL
ncbi:hypothetical protein HDU93_008445 [Gonapodya sp. JEL0774]|nr:hypothetical protein HDU93_008445 [Gonapodya sp. JEL0774]